VMSLNSSDMEYIVGGSNCVVRYAACGAGLALSFSTGPLGLMFLPSTLAICAYAGSC